MTEILDELTEIPFQMFWDKYNEIKPGIYNKDRCEQEWFYMNESDRIKSFEYLCKNHPIIQIIREPYQFLIHFQIPFDTE